MGIKFYCPNGDRLHVKSFLIGKRAICPKCGAKVIVPPESQLAPGAKPADDEGADSDPSISIQPNSVITPTPTPPAADAFTETPDAVWYVRPPTGGQFGPASGEIMRAWINEGRVTSTSLVWRSGWSDWRSAAASFPQLTTSAPQITTSAAPAPVVMPSENLAAATAPPTPQRSSSTALVLVGPKEPSTGTAPSADRAAENEFAAPIMEIAAADAADPARRAKRRGAKGNELWLSVTLVVITLILLGALIVVLMRSSG